MLQNELVLLNTRNRWMFERQIKEPNKHRSESIKRFKREKKGIGFESVSIVILRVDDDLLEKKMSIDR